MGDHQEPAYYKAIGITLALTSGLFIGSSFIFKKKGLIDTNTLHGDVGTGHAYLKSPMWWTGMILMALGEVANFGAYAFSPAILVTPLGALSVVISAILSSAFLNEKLNFSGKVGCMQCLIGATIIVLHAPTTNSTQTIPEFFSYVLAPGFLVYCAFITALVFYLIYVVTPKYGDKHPIVYISICSMGGSFLVLSTQGFGSSIVYSVQHWHDDNQFLQWPIYPLFGFVIFTICVQIHFLNKALNQFSTAIVTPVYYVFFTTMTLVSSAVLFRGFSVDNPISGVSLVMGFLVIVGGVALLFQYSLKVTKVSKLARAAASRQASARRRAGEDAASDEYDENEQIWNEDTEERGDHEQQSDDDDGDQPGLSAESLDDVGEIAKGGAITTASPTKGSGTRRRRPSKVANEGSESHMHRRRTSSNMNTDHHQYHHHHNQQQHKKGKPTNDLEYGTEENDTAGDLSTSQQSQDMPTKLWKSMSTAWASLGDVLDKKSEQIRARQISQQAARAKDGSNVPGISKAGGVGGGNGASFMVSIPGESGTRSRQLTVTMAPASAAKATEAETIPVLPPPPRAPAGVGKAASLSIATTAFAESSSSSHHNRAITVPPISSLHARAHEEDSQQSSEAIYNSNEGLVSHPPSNANR